MSFGEQKRVECTVASTRAAKRLFEQLFRASHGQALHFESVIHHGAALSSPEQCQYGASNSARK
eukprot:16348-Rhodomonas_salina.3